MKIKTTVTVEDSADMNYLYTIFVNALQGDFAEAIASKDEGKIKDIEVMVKKEFDIFANHYFDAGRTYEQENSRFK